MKRIILFAILVNTCFIFGIAQKPSFELTFTASENTSYRQLDSIRIINQSQDCDTILYYPDTILVLDYIVGMDEVSSLAEEMILSQNYPNPVVNSTRIKIYLPDRGLLSCTVSDMNGNIHARSSNLLEKGTHIFTFKPGKGNISLFTAIFQEERKSIRIVSSNHGTNGTAMLEYFGMEEGEHVSQKALLQSGSFHFNLGDHLIYAGYVSGIESGIPDVPESNDTIIFEYAYNIPCPGTPTVTYEGMVYNTVQIFNQCWFKENLNAGTVINIKQAPQNNGIIEKHCYAGIAANCGEYGGLYSWQEMMNYYSIPGSQGICPEGWHIPTDEEFKILEAMADSLYGIGDTIWDHQGSGRGYDAGYNLKSSDGWYENGNGSDKYGFSGKPGGVIWWEPVYGNVYWQGIGKYGHYYTSTQYTYNYEGWFRDLDFNSNSIGRSYNILPTAFSVRCLRDY